MKNLIVKPSRLSGSIAVPGSKSHTIRAIAAALMAEGISEIRAPLVSADTLSTVHAAEALGAVTEMAHGMWRITGTGGKLPGGELTLDLGNSGTGIKLLSAMAALGAGVYTFDGDESLRSRPMKPLLEALQALGCRVSSQNGCCPFTVQGPLKGGTIQGMIAESSQYLSALLFAAPLAASDTEITMALLNEKPYVGITLDWLTFLGIKVDGSADYMSFHVPGRQKLMGFSRTIPADFSSAAFPLGAAAITGSSLTLLNLDFSDSQGDKAVFEIARQMGVKVQTDGFTTTVAGAGLHGGTYDLNATPDALPLLAVMAAKAEGRTRLVNVAQARIKETDRIHCLFCELSKMGVKISELPDGLEIEGGELQGAEVESYGDHRLAMALAVAGLAAQGETMINGADCAAVTYPEFVSDFQKIGADMTWA